MMMMMKVSMLVSRVPVATAAAAWTSRQSISRIRCLSSMNWNHVKLQQQQQQQQQRSFHRMESRPQDYSNSALQSQRNDDDVSSNFRNNFRGTRVFVQGIPPTILDWRQVKDHFKIAGEVVFASISVERSTGKSKGCGIVQYETTEMAQRAIQIMRNHPMDDDTPLYVRPDYQEKSDNGRQLSASSRRSSQRPRDIWRFCPNDNNDDNSTMEEDEDAMEEIKELIQQRDLARRQKNYAKSDTIREKLKENYQVSMDDRLKLWWISSSDESPPSEIMELKGQGRWKNKQLNDWRQIPTTPDQDDRVDASKVQQLLIQRDAARRQKKYDLADELLEQAKTSCGTDNQEHSVKIHVQDDERTWRVWTEEKPNFAAKSSPRQQCLDLIERYEPSRMAEMETLLDRFPGREYVVLRKLQEKFL